MHVLIIGLGSMGKRRMRLLHKISVDKQLDIELFGTDGREDRRKEAMHQAAELGFNISTYESLADVVESNNKIDAAVISTSPLSHAAIIKECLEYGLNVFTELNLVTDGYDENMALAEEKGLKLFLSSTPIYRDEMRYITSQVHKTTKKLNYTYHIGQYLTDWHPWENYKDFFIGNKRTNGCREILAVELPWIVNAFGDIESVCVVSDRKTSLEIDYDDCYNILIKHISGHTGVLTVDVISRPPIRSMVITGEDIYISWNGSPDGIKEYVGKDKELQSVNMYTRIEQREGYNPTIIENMYVTELLDFLAVLKGEKEGEYSFEKDKKILGIIDEIEGL